MWGYVLVAVPVLAWFAWRIRRPHHHHTGGGRFREMYSQKSLGWSRLGREYRNDEPTPREHAAPGDYDGD
jgi:hypothetical protein